MTRRVFVFIAVLLFGCTPAKPLPPTAPAPAPSAPAAPAPQPPSPAPAPSAAPAPPGQSTVTWTITSLDEPWIRSPFTVAVRLPHRFRFAFSAPVDRLSVDAALNGHLSAYQVGLDWVDGQTVDVSINAGPPTQRWSFLSLTALGGTDAAGAALAGGFEGTILLGVGQETTLWRWEHGKEPDTAAKLPGPFDVLSVSPDGQRLALRRFGLPQAGGFPPVGPAPGFAYWYHVPSGRLEQLEGVAMWLSPQWLPDGSLLVSGSHGGTGLMRVAPDGAQTPLVRGRRVVDYAVEPAGRHVAAFLANGTDEAGDIWLFDLQTGAKREFPGAFTPSSSPNGVPLVSALWSPDGATLAYTDRTGKNRDSGGADRVVLMARTTGDRWTVAEEAGRPESWSPDSTYLLIRGHGVVAPDSRLVLEVSVGGTGAFSPAGDRVFLVGRGIYRAPGWELVAELSSFYRHAAWAPGGGYLLLSGGDGPPLLYTRDGIGISQAPDGAGAGPEDPPLWSPRGSFVILNERWLLHTEQHRYHELPSGLGVPVGWTREEHLYLAPGKGPGDGIYVKPALFGR